MNTITEFDELVFMLKQLNALETEFYHKVDNFDGNLTVAHNNLSGKAIVFQYDNVYLIGVNGVSYNPNTGRVEIRAEKGYTIWSDVSPVTHECKTFIKHANFQSLTLADFIKTYTGIGSDVLFEFKVHEKTEVIAHLASIIAPRTFLEIDAALDAQGNKEFLLKEEYDTDICPDGI